MSWVGITGAAQGLGREMSELFLAEKYEVIGVDLHGPGLQELAAKYPGSFHPYQLDLTDRAATERVMGEISTAHGVPAIWINNAGVATIARFEKAYKSFAKVMRLNFETVLDLTHFWLLEMERAGGGQIVNVASVAGHVAAPFFTSYSASKFAVVGFTQALTEELKLKKSAVKITLLSPGFVDTAIMRGQDVGLPEMMHFLRPGPRECAEEMVASILKGEEFYCPTLNGKIMFQIARVGGPIKQLALKLFTRDLPKDVWDK